jgi:hypothetical protein
VIRTATAAAAAAAASHLKRLVILAKVVVQGGTWLTIVHQLMDKRVILVVTIRISSGTAFVVADRVVDIFQLVVLGAGAGNAILIVEVIDGEITVIRAIQAKVSVVVTFTGGKIVDTVAVVVPVVIVVAIVA